MNLAPVPRIRRIKRIVCLLPQEQARVQDVIEIFDKESFLESNEFSDEGLVLDSDNEKNEQSSKIQE